MMRYTRELLEPVVASCTSYAQVVRALGVRWSGGRQMYVKRAIRRLGLDVGHFHGQGANRGARHKGGPDKLHHTQVLVLDRFGDGRRETCERLYRAFIESGVPERCECGVGTVWNGRRLRLHIDHRNGNGADNRPENLRFLCPNCHTQTENYGSKNARRDAA